MKVRAVFLFNIGLAKEMEDYTEYFGMKMRRVSLI